MAGDLVLITGVTGHIGFRVLRYALEYGFKVRAVVRSEQKAQKVLSNPVLRAMKKESQLSFVVVSDFLAPGAFNEAVKDVQYIIHVASPLMTSVPEGSDPMKAFIEPAIKITTGVFESAKVPSSIKRIVVTSSALAMFPITSLFEKDPKVYGADSRLPTPELPLPNNFFAYAASKIAAFNAAEKWIKEEKPAFDVIHIHPSFVFGRDDLCTSTEDMMTSTNNVVLRLALNRVDPDLSTLSFTFNHVDDCARVHVLALDPKIEGNQSFVTSNNGHNGTYDQTSSIVSKHFPEAVGSGVLPNNGKYTTIHANLDASKTEKVFGFKHASYEECVVSAVGHYLEVREKEAEKKSVVESGNKLQIDHEAREVSEVL